jgi:hypothetical protein
MTYRVKTREVYDMQKHTSCAGSWLFCMTCSLEVVGGDVQFRKQMWCYNSRHIRDGNVVADMVCIIMDCFGLRVLSRCSGEMREMRKQTLYSRLTKHTRLDIHDGHT